MNVAIKIFKIFAPVPNHRPGKCGQRFGRDLNWSRREKFVVTLHSAATSDVEGGTSNAEWRHTDRRYCDRPGQLRLGFAEMKLIVPLRSSRAMRTLDKSSLCMASRRSSSRS